MDAPKNGARCRPLMNPSTTVRASSSRLPIRDRIFGSTKRAPGRAWVSILRIADCGLWIMDCSFWIAESAFSTAIRNPQSAIPNPQWLHSALWRRHGRQQLVDNRIGADAFRFGAEIREHAVSQDRVRQRADVVEAHVVASARERTRFGAEH